MYGISNETLWSNNPQIDATCSNIYIGEVLCVDTESYTYPSVDTGLYEVSRLLAVEHSADFAATRLHLPPLLRVILMTLCVFLSAVLFAFPSLYDGCFDSYSFDKTYAQAVTTSGSHTLPFCPPVVLSASFSFTTQPCTLSKRDAEYEMEIQTASERAHADKFAHNVGNASSAPHDMASAVDLSTYRSHPPCGITSCKARSDSTSNPIREYRASVSVVRVMQLTVALFAHHHVLYIVCIHDLESSIRCEIPPERRSAGAEMQDFQLALRGVLCDQR